MNSEQKKDNGQPSITFTIDGVPYTTNDRRQTAEELLRLAGVDPADHDLARVVGHGNVKPLNDNDEIQITPDAKFISLFRGPTPVV
jgi:hypothetical protein